jgi:hypothetical protein
MRATIGPREAQSGNSDAMKFMVRSSPLGMKRLTVTGFGIEMASAAPSSAIDGGAQRNENKSKEQSWRMVTLMNDLAAGMKQRKWLFHLVRDARTVCGSPHRHSIGSVKREWVMRV